jgi:hypothetical protein
MLAQILAIALWLGSLGLYGAAFFFPEVHRRHDFFWSGVAAFYGLVLWLNAVQISPAELLGHGASLALLGWFGWQTLSLRRKRTPVDLQTPLTPESWPSFRRQLSQAVLGWLRATPLGRWLPQPTASMPGDPAIAVAQIRVSSLKDVDYEFVDELAPESELGSRAIATATPPSPTAAPSAPPPAKPVVQPAVGRSQPRPTPQPQPSPLATRLAGLQAWVQGLTWPSPVPKPMREVAKLKREVIDIPPRPSPLSRKSSQSEGAQSEGAQPQKTKPGGTKRRGSTREVIDIPPRPSPLDRKKPIPQSKPQTPEAPPPTVTIVDTTAVQSDGDASVPIPSPPLGPEAPDTPAETTNSPETNWDDDDSNWIDD